MKPEPRRKMPGSRPEDRLPVETRFKPGQSGNPSGMAGKRPRAKTLDDFWREIPISADTKKPALDEDGKPLDRWRVMLLAAWNAAVNPRHKDQVEALKLMLAYELGKPVTRLEMSGADGGPVQIQPVAPEDRQAIEAKYEAASRAIA